MVKAKVERSREVEERSIYSVAMVLWMRIACSLGKTQGPVDRVRNNKTITIWVIGLIDRDGNSCDDHSSNEQPNAAGARWSHGQDSTDDAGTSQGPGVYEYGPCSSVTSQGPGVQKYGLNIPHVNEEHHSIKRLSLSSEPGVNRQQSCEHF